MQMKNEKAPKKKKNNKRRKIKYEENHIMIETKTNAN